MADALSGADAAKAAREQLTALLGAEVESVSAVDFSDERWYVTLEVLELRRVPPTTDILASYDIELNGNGEVMKFRRKARYTRNQVSSAHGL